MTGTLDIEVGRSDPVVSVWSSLDEERPTPEIPNNHRDSPPPPHLVLLANPLVAVGVPHLRNRPLTPSDVAMSSCRGWPCSARGPERWPKGFSKIVPSWRLSSTSSRADGTWEDCPGCDGRRGLDALALPPAVNPRRRLRSQAGLRPGRRSREDCGPSRLIQRMAERLGGPLLAVDRALRGL